MAVGIAGRNETGVRSDLKVRFEPRESGGIELQLKSKVEHYYGKAIRAQVASICEALKVEHAFIEIDDRGALPYVIAARIECAARRAFGNDSGSVHAALPEPLDHEHSETARDRLRRSRLYLPGNEPKIMINALLYGSDAIILDLEDAVAPREKDAARVLVRNALRSVDFGLAERMVRINPGELGFLDLDEIIPQAPNMILIPKCESAAEVLRVEEHIDQLNKKNSKKHPIWFMPILESAMGIEKAFEIASCSPRVAALTIGVEDYAADMGVARTPDGQESLYARMRLVNAAKAAGVQAIDSVFSDVADLDGLKQNTLAAKALGFEGKGCIHPRQIAVVHEALAPSSAEIENAQRIVKALELAMERGDGVVALGNKMIDAPVVQRAQHTMDLAAKLGLLDKNLEAT